MSQCELLTCSPEPAVASWPTSSSDMSLSSPSSGTPTPAKSCASDSPACESSKAMCEPWISRESWLASMRCALASLVRTSAQQEKEPGSPESEADSIGKSCEQLTLFGLHGSSSKTAHSSEPEADTSSLPTLWRVDIPGAMDSLPRLMSERLISEIGGGALPRFPTPLVGGANESTHNQISGRFRDALKKAWQKWPTPLARDWKSGSKATKQNSRPLSEEVGGALNPEWVEWLMGWPIGHTESKLWGTGKSRSKRQRPGSRSAGRTPSDQITEGKK